jgi:hypothetical protein
MVNNIHNTDETLSLTTNAGVLTTNKKAVRGEVWFSADAVTNIFSMAHMVDCHTVTYDAKKEDAFIVHLPHKQVCMNAIKNNPVTTKDIEIAEKIFGPDISSLKGKTTRQKPIPVIEDYI